MADDWQNIPADMTVPADRHTAITPGTSAVSPKPRALFCVVSGNVVIEDRAGTQLVYPVTAGQVYAFRATKVLATGTSGSANGQSTTATVVGWD